VKAHYRLDPGKGRFTVQAFAGGLLSVFAHSPTFSVGTYEGGFDFDPATLEGTGFSLVIRADSLTLVDQVSAADRREIEDRMRREVLETAVYPEIRFEAGYFTASPVTGNQHRVALRGLLALHGVTNHHEAETNALVYEDGIRLSGESGLRPSEYRIRPVTAVGGTIKLKDQLRLVFDLVCWKNGQATGDT
jgi:polyisoprenoid-binding protein YceI